MKMPNCKVIPVLHAPVRRERIVVKCRYEFWVGANPGFKVAFWQFRTGAQRRIDTNRGIQGKKPSIRRPWKVRIASLIVPHCIVESELCISCLNPGISMQGESVSREVAESPWSIQVARDRTRKCFFLNEFSTMWGDDNRINLTRCGPKGHLKIDENEGVVTLVLEICREPAKENSFTPDNGSADKELHGRCHTHCRWPGF